MKKEKIDVKVPLGECVNNFIKIGAVAGTGAGLSCGIAAELHTIAWGTMPGIFMLGGTVCGFLTGAGLGFFAGRKVEYDLTKPQREKLIKEIKEEREREAKREAERERKRREEEEKNRDD